MRPNLQRRELLAEFELGLCVRYASAWDPPRTVSAASAPVVLSYATSPPPRRWLLGLTAALRGWPIALAGQGYAGFNYKTLSVTKVFGLRRALQILHRLRPASLVLLADMSDTVLLGGYSPHDGSIATAAAWQAHERIVRAAGSDSASVDTVAANAECASFPKCFDHLYVAASAQLPQVRMCHLASKPTCYANSGAFLGRTGAMLATFDAMARMHTRWERALAEALAQHTTHVVVRNSSRASHRLPNTLHGVTIAPGLTGDVGKTERHDDQALFSLLYLAQRHENVSIALDVDGDAFVSTHECKGWPPKGNLTLRRKMMGPFAICHRRPWTPLSRLVAPQPTEAATPLLRGIRYRSIDGVVRSPLLLHSNGQPKRGIPFTHGRKPKEARELLYAVEKAIKDALGEGQGEGDKASTSLMDHAVLLLDPAAGAHRPCAMTSLRKLLHSPPRNQSVNVSWPAWAQRESSFPHGPVL